MARVTLGHRELAAEVCVRVCVWEGGVSVCVDAIVWSCLWHPRRAARTPPPTDHRVCWKVLRDRSVSAADRAQRAKV